MTGTSTCATEPTSSSSPLPSTTLGKHKAGLHPAPKLGVTTGTPAPGWDLRLKPRGLEHETPHVKGYGTALALRSETAAAILQPYEAQSSADAAKR